MTGGRAAPAGRLWRRPNWLAAAALSLTPTVASPTPRDASPSALLTAVYRQAVAEDGSPWLAPRQRPKYLSRSLLALWARADAMPPPKGDVGPIDFDLTADTNGLRLASFVLKVEKQDRAAATIAVALDYVKPYTRSDKAVVTYDLVREPAGWRVDEIRSRRWSVRRLLSDWVKGG